MRVLQSYLLCGVVLLLLSVPLCAQDRALVDAYQRALLPGRAVDKAAVAPASEQPTLILHLTFALNSAELTSEAVRYLTALGTALTEGRAMRSYIYRVEGHTCDRGNAHYNKRLSGQRAQSAVDYLVRNFNLQRQQFQIVGHGEDQPIAPNTTETGRQRNRRVAIVNTLQTVSLPEPGQLALDVRVSYVRGGSIEILPPRATLTQRDGYAIEFVPNDAAFIYVCQADADEVELLFPNTSFSQVANPAVAGHLYRVPHMGKWFYLDDYKGIEHIVVMAHREALDTPKRFCQEALKTELRAASRGLGGIRVQPEYAGAVRRRQLATKTEPIVPDYVWKQSFLHQ